MQTVKEVKKEKRNSPVRGFELRVPMKADLAA